MVLAVVPLCDGFSPGLRAPIARGSSHRGGFRAAKMQQAPAP
eukprot:CAMPEP_0174943324 /NCGR_PEP_ID=MMETSP1355-20121228/76438_1 /TAXON_ID=464990 /ORGANISM="Hemiselmis tepida, Strain CCMP443" /LENGTH=41 /DNA_ID= /DNA_START= /DNA_END= /DNA_ORIENTATION=